MYKYRLVSRLIDTPSEYGAGILRAYFERPFILLSIAYSNEGVIDYLGTDAIAKAPGDGTSDELYLLQVAKNNPLHFDQLGDLGRLPLLAASAIDMPENTATELHITTAAAAVVITYLEKIDNWQ